MQTITTPAGEKLVVLSEEEYEDLIDARVAAAAERDLAAGRLELLTEDEVRDYLAAPTPLAFWRQRRDLSPAKLALAAHMPEEALAQMEAGVGDADVATYARLARHLRVTVDSLLPRESAAAAGSAATQ